MRFGNDPLCPRRVTARFRGSEGEKTSRHYDRYEATKLAVASFVGIRVTAGM